MFCVLFVSMFAKWLAGKTLVVSFVSKGFPYKDQIEELFIVMFYCMYFQHVIIVNFLINFTSFNCNILIKGTI